MNKPTTQAYAELQAAYDHYNQELFDGKLPRCLITLQRKKRTHGYFSSKRFIDRNGNQTVDEIALNPEYFAVVPLLEVLQTIVHEQVHLFQAHFGRPGRRGYHNKQWANKMISIGLMPSDTGQPGGKITGEHMADYPIEGGRFLAATQKLKDQAFAITWYDRFPARIGALVGKPITEFDSSDAKTNSDSYEDVPHLAGVIQLQSEPNRSNRVKYRCPCCSVQLWGKPGIMVLCGNPKCQNATFAAVE